MLISLNECVAYDKQISFVYIVLFTAMAGKAIGKAYHMHIWRSCRIPVYITLYYEHPKVIRFAISGFFSRTKTVHVRKSTFIEWHISTKLFHSMWAYSHGKNRRGDFFMNIQHGVTVVGEVKSVYFRNLASDDNGWCRCTRQAIVVHSVSHPCCPWSCCLIVSKQYHHYCNIFYHCRRRRHHHINHHNNGNAASPRPGKCCESATWFSRIRRKATPRRSATRWAQNKTRRPGAGCTTQQQS